MLPKAFARWLLAIPALSVFAVVMTAQSQRPVTITRVTVLDTIRGQAIPDSMVTLDKGAIVSVARSGTPPSGAQVIDGQGKFLIPGLWDMHAHHQLTGEASLPLFIATGVTGTRDMGADLEFILRLRQRTESRQALGPVIVAAGPILDNRPPDWPLRLNVRSADDARKAVQMLKERGVDLIKVHTATPADVYFAIAEETRKHNLPFAGHLPRGVTFEQAAAAGQRSIEHLDSGRAYTQCSGGQGYSVEQCRPFFSWLAKSGMWQTPTLVNWRKMFTLGTPYGNAEEDHFAYASPQIREFLALNRKMSNVTPEAVQAMVAMSETAAIATNDMQRAGVGILAGCDGMVAGFCLHDELALMVRGGMSTAAALQTATINPARYLGLEQRFGSVAVGKRADLVLLDANPLDDISNVGRIQSVIIGGKVLSRQELDETLATVRRQFQAGAAVAAPQ
jgi:hypothetical protein